MRAIIPIGSPIRVFETAVTTIIRVAEAYDIDKVLILYPPFSSWYLRDILDFLKFVSFSIDIEIQEVKPTISDEDVDAILSKGDILIPSASSVIYIIKMVKRASLMKIPIDHIMFPFGSWYGLYYPFVPRFIVPTFEGKERINEILDEEKATKAIDIWLKGRELSKIIGKLSLEFNSNEKRNYKYGENVNLCIDEEYKIKDSENGCLIELKENKIFLNGKEVTPNQLMEALFKDRATLDKVLGFYSLKVLLDSGEYELRELVRRYRGILVDTNLIYNGIVFYPDINTFLPYCAYIEIANNRSSYKENKVKRIANDLAWIYVQELLNRSVIVPTPVFFCDAILPMIDPMLIKDTLILSYDEAAISHWKSVITNAEVGKLKLEEKDSFNELSFSLMLLSWVLKNYL